MSARIPLTVHIIDDDESVRRSLGRLMRASGFNGLIHQSPEDFLQQVCASDSGCILLDITMPGMSGLDFLAQLRKQGFGMPVIALSARDDEDTRSALKELGVNFFLRKPVDEQALIDAIHWVGQELL